MVCHTNFTNFLYTLQYINFLSLSDKESKIVSAITLVHASGKQGEIKVLK